MYSRVVQSSMALPVATILPRTGATLSQVVSVIFGVLMLMLVVSLIMIKIKQRQLEREDD
ncbi:LPXTG cell wall anchor domain-containing protein [Limosilactobacillus equigenerosi]|nr:LPXTG cell wall anchor domain-containing protein [Limosilactobacillus equigenerosi]